MKPPASPQPQKERIPVAEPVPETIPSAEPVEEDIPNAEPVEDDIPLAEPRGGSERRCGNEGRTGLRWN